MKYTHIRRKFEMSLNMRRPDIPINEDFRMYILNQLKLLDSSFEEGFDRITKLAQNIFDVPIALVSLIDINRQWFKSCLGLDVRETSREISFCGHTILGDEILAIENALLDERFADNPLVTGDPNIRFYAGCPIRYLDGSKLGTLCIIDTTKRIFNKDDRENLKNLAKLVEDKINTVELAIIDPLTKILNRRGFEMAANNILKTINSLNIPSILIYFDINKFKEVNDNHGHKEGDLLLKAFSKGLKRTIRNADIIGRIGGDEFILILVNCTLEGTKLAIERFNKNLEVVSEELSLKSKICYSHGAQEITDDSLESLLFKADKLMYDCKRKG